MTGVMFHMSCVTIFFFCKVVELVSGWSVINRAYPIYLIHQPGSLGWVWGQWHLTNSCWPSWATHQVEWTHKIQFPLLDTILHTAHKIQFSIPKYSLACPLLPAKARLLNLPTPSQKLGKCAQTQCMQAIVTSKIIYQLKKKCNQESKTITSCIFSLPFWRNMPVVSSSIVKININCY